MKMRCSSMVYLDFTDASTFIKYVESSTDVRFRQHAAVAAHGRHVRAPSRPELHALHVPSLRVASGTASTKSDCSVAAGRAVSWAAELSVMRCPSAMLHTAGPHRRGARCAGIADARAPDPRGWRSGSWRRRRGRCRSARGAAAPAGVWRCCECSARTPAPATGQRRPDQSPQACCRARLRSLPRATAR